MSNNNNQRYRDLIQKCEDEIAIKEEEMLEHEQRNDRVLANNCQKRIVELQERIKGYQVKISPQIDSTSIHTTSSDPHYEILCKFDFKKQVEYFNAIINSDLPLISFVIRGQGQGDCGQRWLYNRFIHEYGHSDRGPIIVDMGLFNLKLEDLVDKISEALSINNRNVKMRDKKGALLRELFNKTKYHNQFIVLNNAYDFLHSEHFEGFNTMLDDIYGILKSNVTGKKCIFLFVQTNNEFTIKDEYVIWANKTVAHTARCQDDPKFIVLDNIDLIKEDDINAWLNAISKYQCECLGLGDGAKRSEVLTYAGKYPNELIDFICRNLETPPKLKH